MFGVGAGTEIGFDRVHTGGMDSNNHLAGAGHRQENLFKLQNLRPAELMDANRFHKKRAVFRSLHRGNLCG